MPYASDKNLSYLSLNLITINVAKLDEVIMVLRKREMERNILAGIDRLVHVLIDLSCAQGKEKDELLEQAIQMVRDVTPPLLVLLGGKEEHLENLLRQLITQKLPSGLALDSFGPLKRDLDTILTMAFFRDPEETTQPMPEEVPDEVPDEVPEEVPANEQEPMEEATPETTAIPEQEDTTVSPAVSTKPGHDLALLLQRIFPAATIHQGYMFRSLCLDYYLPEQSLAILIIYPGVRTIPALEHLLKKVGITLVKLQPSELDHPALFVQKLSRMK